MPCRHVLVVLQKPAHVRETPMRHFIPELALTRPVQDSDGQGGQVRAR